MRIPFLRRSRIKGSYGGNSGRTKADGIWQPGVNREPEEEKPVPRRFRRLRLRRLPWGRRSRADIGPVGVALLALLALAAIVVLGVTVYGGK